MNRKHYFFIAFLFIVHTVNAQWVALNSTITDPLQQLYFKDNNNGFAVTATFSTGGKIMATTNGQSWSQRFTCSDYLFTIDFPSDEIGYAGGGGIGLTTGAVYKTTNGGTTWSKINATILPQVYSLNFTSDSIGYAAANDATSGHYYIYKTLNGGLNWAIADSGFDYIRHVFFSSDSVGYVAGDNGRIFKTSDAGANWSLLNTNVVFHFNASYFVNDTVGWAVGSYINGGIYKTIDGGATWVSQTIPTQKNLSGIYFTSSTHGWAVGENGVILKTTNAGTTWTAVTPVNTNWNYAVVFPSANIGYAVGAQGNIIKYSIATGLDEHTSVNSLSIFPNPANDVLSVHITSNNKPEAFVIRDLSGRILKSGSLSEGVSTIDIQALPSGMYLLQMQDGQFETLKFVKD